MMEIMEFEVEETACFFELNGLLNELEDIEAADYSKTSEAAVTISKPSVSGKTAGFDKNDSEVGKLSKGIENIRQANTNSSIELQNKNEDAGEKALKQLKQLKIEDNIRVNVTPKVRSRFLVAFGIIEAMTLIVAIVGMYGMFGIWTKSSYVFDTQMPKIHDITNLEDAQKTMGIAIRGLLNRRIFLDSDIKNVHLDMLKDGIQKWDDAYKSAEENQNYDAAEKEKWVEYIALAPSWRAGYDKFMEIFLEKDKLYSQGVHIDDAKIKELDDQMYSQFKVVSEKYTPMLNILDASIADMNQDIDLAKNEAQSKKNSAVSLMVAAVIIIGAISVVLSLFIPSSLSNMILKMKKTIAMTQNVDLTVRSDINSKDELGDLAKTFNGLMQKTSEAIRKIGDTT
ncbi:MAG: methyl-accepting chemotaxis protein [Bacillota bacterium]|nr:methyl-accepting chemotaxis protein [Bacillota bacterium]